MEEFWQIRELKEIGKEQEALALLRKRKKAFKRREAELESRLHSWDLWGAAYVIFGGCSDDGFQDFKGGLLGLETRFLRAALKCPDNLADIPDSTLKTLRSCEFGSIGTEEPSGEPWDEDEDALKSRFPRLWAKYGERPIEEDF